MFYFVLVLFIEGKENLDNFSHHVFFFVLFF